MQAGGFQVENKGVGQRRKEKMMPEMSFLDKC